MKTKILGILVFLFIQGCNNIKNTDDFYSSIDTRVRNTLIDLMMEDFGKLDIQKETLEYLACKKIISLSDFIISNENYKIKDSIHMFFSIIRYSGLNMPDDYVKNLMNDRKDVIDSKIKMYEYISISNLVERYKNSYFIFGKGAPIVVPSNSILKLGEEFQADFYFACTDQYRKNKIVIDGDTINEDLKTTALTYKTVPKEKGVYKVKGQFIINQPLAYGVHSFGFDINYTVK